MATYTSNYGWTKPSGSDNVDISVLNNNLDDQDSTIHDAFLNMAPPFSESSTYAVDDIVLYGTGLYKCHTAVVTPGSWTGSTNWQVYKLSEGGSGGGGTSNYNQLSNKPQINSVELSGNKTSSQLGLMSSDGVVANPTGQTTGTLTALEVGGTKYAVPSGGTSDYTNLTNKPQVNGVELSGNKTASQLGMANSNTFQGTIVEWNQLTTAEKKAYDHASIPDSIDGGVTFPANKVVMTGGGDVENAITNLVKTETKQVTVTGDANHVVMLGVSKPNVVVNVEISGLIVLGYTTYANEWLCSLADYSGTQVTSGTYTATIYYI